MKQSRYLPKLVNYSQISWLAIVYPSMTRLLKFPLEELSNKLQLRNFQ